MRHTREEVIQRTIQEFELLDHLVANLTDEDWQRLLPRSETKVPWTVKDALAHITHWKADVTRSIRRQPQPPEERGLTKPLATTSFICAGATALPRRFSPGTGRSSRMCWPSYTKRPKHGSAVGSTARNGPTTSTGTRLTTGSRISNGRCDQQSGCRFWVSSAGAASPISTRSAAILPPGESRP
jgi:hypothetical protein